MSAEVPKFCSVKERADGNWKLCPLCDAPLEGCHIGGYCSNKDCGYVDGSVWLLAAERERLKDKLEPLK